MRILAVETSCDETAVALVEASGGLRRPRFKILKNLVASQIKIHRPYGGVVPNLAKREHLKNLPILFKKIQNLKSEIKNLDLIAVTVAPGLEPALWTGISFAKEIFGRIKKSGNKKIKLAGVNHLEGHLHSFLLIPGFRFEAKTIFPTIALLASGGHTVLLLMNNFGDYKKLGETRDDAAGEAFDKAARLMGLLYPGGPEIEKLARSGDSSAINFPRPMMNQKNYDFSFSGLKTAVLYYLRDNKNTDKGDVAASFQAAAFDVLIVKTLRAAEEFGAKSVILAGGVASSGILRRNFRREIKKRKLKISFIVPPKKFCLDNAAMMAVSAYINNLKNKNYRLAARSDVLLK